MSEDPNHSHELRNSIQPEFYSTFETLVATFHKQFLKYSFFSFLNHQDRISMRSTCQTLHNGVPRPRYTFFETKPGHSRVYARLEINTGFVETRMGADIGCFSREILDDFSRVADELQSNVETIFSNVYAFAAKKRDGRIITWGMSEFGGNSDIVAPLLQSGIVHIFSTQEAFAALKTDGNVVAWGNFNDDDPTLVMTHIESGVVKIVPNQAVFAAIKSNGSVVAWGSATNGGDISDVHVELQSGVVDVFSTCSSFAALKLNGRVVTWPHTDVYNGGNSAAVSHFLQNGVTHVACNKYAMAALTNEGRVITWGGHCHGEENEEVSRFLMSDVVHIEPLQIQHPEEFQGFRATKCDGTVMMWES